MAWARRRGFGADIAVGAVITEDMVWVKRPSPGPGAIPAKDLGKVVGMTAKVDIAKDKQILWEELA